MAEYIFKSKLLKTAGKGGVSKRPKLIMDFCDVDSDKWLQYSKESSFPLQQVYKSEYERLQAYERKVYLFCDEFTNYNDVEIGITALKLLARLGYDVEIVEEAEIETLLDQLRMRQLSREQIVTYQQQQAAAEKLKDLKKAQAVADKQTELTHSKVQVQIVDNNGEAELWTSSKNHENEHEAFRLGQHCRNCWCCPVRLRGLIVMLVLSPHN